MIEQKVATEAALSYAARGWRVFPLHSGPGCSCGKACDSPAKHPRLLHGLKEATTDASTIRGWWARWPAANVAIATGEASGVVVLDVDPEHGGAESLSLLEREHGELPETAEALTGGGGRHVLFRHPAVPIRNKVALAPGLDVRGDGGYIVAPPSVHASGARYEWEAAHHPDDREPALPPPWLLELLAGGRNGRPKAAPLPERIPAGQRNATLASLAGSMRRRGASAAAIEAALVRENDRCDPPLPVAEVRSVAESIAAYAAPKAGHDPGRYFSKEDGFIPARLGEEVREAGRLRVGVDGRLWRYRGGAYRPDGDAFVSEFVRARLAEKFRRRCLEEVLAWCRAEFPSIPERPDPYVLNLSSGLLDWRTGEHREHDAEFPSIVQLPVRWDERALCPGIERFLAEVLPEDAVELAFEIAGYCMLADQPFRKAVMLLGSGGNGKSVFLGVLRALLGRENVAAVPLQSLAESRFAAAEVYGKLANIAGDLDARALRRSDTFKVLTGGTDAVMAERKYRDPFTFVPFATLVFSANEPPASGDQTDAYFDRWIVLPFERRFSEEEADPHLLPRLVTSEELSGFLLRAVDALGNLMERGRFDLPPSVREAGRLYRERIDTVSTFVEECCLVAGGARVTRRALYEAYREWCGRNGRIPISQQNFAPRLRQELGASVDEGKIGEDRGWRGIGLRV